ncbi:hypothetical protein HT72_01623 [Listeria monocytogenes]|nr:hypothetical protein HT72_01623 [Listeria monocytogenes]
MDFNQQVTLIICTWIVFHYISKIVATIKGKEDRNDEQ